ncbi:MAG: hypothetical protein OXC94_03750 [Chloroflexi bacterium]|nr:hypothetical protein [Chloroflexota bacterium]
MTPSEVALIVGVLALVALAAFVGYVAWVVAEVRGRSRLAWTLACIAFPPAIVALWKLPPGYRSPWDR